MKRGETAEKFCDLCGSTYTTQKPWLARYCDDCKHIATNLSHQNAAKRKRPLGTPKKTPPILTKACVDCGTPFETTYRPTLRCVACRLKRHRQTGLHGSLDPRPCTHCGLVIETPASNAQRMHPECRLQRKNDAQRVKAYNLRVTAKRVGAEMVCAGCGGGARRTSGWQKYCVACAAPSSDRARRHRVSVGLPPEVPPTRWTNICVDCETSFETTRRRTLRCAPCRQKREAEQESLRAYHRRTTDKRVGAVMMCDRCGLETARRSSTQRYCTSCAITSSATAREICAGRGLQPWSGRTDTEYTAARLLALSRDHYVCRRCGARDCRLEVHHIDGKGTTLRRQFRNNALGNLITLCVPCHRRVQRHPELLQPQRVEIRAAGAGQEIVEVG